MACSKSSKSAPSLFRRALVAIPTYIFRTAVFLHQPSLNSDFSLSAIDPSPAPRPRLLRGEPIFACQPLRGIQ